MTWCEFEKSLQNEFIEILKEFQRLRSSLTEETRKDFTGLLRYTLKDRQSFREIIGKETELLDLDFDCSKISNCDNVNIYNCENVNIYDLLASIDVLLHIDPINCTFSSHFNNFPLILSNWQQFPPDSLVQLCEKFWKARYPSVKESFIIPVSLNIFTRHPRKYEESKLKSLLISRLAKGKLSPFDQSVALAKLFNLDARNFDYCDRQLATLKEILRNNRNSRQESLLLSKQFGCHCD